LEAAKAFSAGDVDLAVARADAEDLSAAQTVVVFTRGVVLIVVPPGISISDMDDLKGKVVGVVGGQVNHKVVEALKKEYDLDRAKVQFKDLTVGADATDTGALGLAMQQLANAIAQRRATLAGKSLLQV
jgi:ABC-type nitrate/sulfonate/bicarbonate transport system substrate-binding protein